MSYHLIIVDGADRGLTITVKPEGIRLGRASNNDVALKDPLASRFHCRFFFEKDGGLWLEDLGAANPTLLNEKSVQTARVKQGDLVTIGETIIKVVNDTKDILNGNADPEQQPPSPPAFSLFDRSNGGKKEAGRKISFRRAGSSNQSKFSSKILFFVLVIFAGTLIALIVFFSLTDRSKEPLQNLSAVAPLEIHYEKVEATTNNIFRYEMELKEGLLSVQIDDLAEGRHIDKNQRKKISDDAINELLKEIKRNEFFQLDTLYQEPAKDSLFSISLSITSGTKTHKVKVINAGEVAHLHNLRELLENFVENELGLAALALSKEKLLALAEEAMLRGKMLYDQRNIKDDNLFKAAKALKECEIYLETFEEKPSYYKEANSLKLQAECELQSLIDELMFQAERAIKLAEWQEAARALRTVMEKVPERTDERYRSAEKKLLDVEKRLKKK
jgi:hypothetical protein